MTTKLSRLFRRLWMYYEASSEINEMMLSEQQRRLRNELRISDLRSPMPGAVDFRQLFGRSPRHEEAPRRERRPCGDGDDAAGGDHSHGV